MLILKLLYILFRLSLFPLFYLFILVNKKVRDRIFFEGLNKLDSSSVSFKKINIKADYLFEVSSEGELEQALPIIEFFINQDKKIELVFSSDSVEKKCKKLAASFPNNLRILRFKILSFNPFSRFSVSKWATANKIILTRYDFFPELLFLGARKTNSFYLIAGTLKNFDSKSKFAKFYLNIVYTHFDKIIMATKNDISLFKRFFPNSKADLLSYDFRPFQIIKRQSKSTEKLRDHSEALNEYMHFLEEFDSSKRIVFGSFWDDENIITDKIDELIDNGVHLAFVPHKLSENDLLNLFNYLKKYTNKPIYEINASMGKSEYQSVVAYAKKEPGLFILNIKGVLCELYKYYRHAYIAGGYRLSVHSLLEPALASCHVYFGPKVYRSTEYDLLSEWVGSNIHLVDKPQDIINTIYKNLDSKIESVDEFSRFYLDHLESTFEWIK